MRGQRARGCRARSEQGGISRRVETKGRWRIQGEGEGEAKRCMGVEVL